MGMGARRRAGTALALEEGLDRGKDAIGVVDHKQQPPFVERGAGVRDPERDHVANADVGLNDEIKLIQQAIGLLLGGGEALDRSIDAVLAAFAQGPFIFNLGHGVLPQTPIAHVERLVERVRQRSAVR